MSHPILAVFNLGGGEIILILAILLVLGLGAAAAGLIIFVVVGLARKDRTAASPQPPDLEQQLRTLAKLKADGVITPEDFDAKKKALLGL